MRINKIMILSFFAVYVIWGSTYLAIKYAIETLPPFGMSSVRFFCGAAILFLISHYKKEGPLTRDEKKISAFSGILLIFANAVVCLVEFWVPSGIVAVIIGAMPIWIMLVGWMFFRHARPTILRVLGSLIGLAGVALITFGGAVPEVSGIGRFGTLFLIGSSFLWAIGTLIQKKSFGVKSVFRFSSFQMLAGAIPTGMISLVFEKPWEYFDKGISGVSILAFLYLVIFGSVIAFTAYSWLSRNVDSHLVSTYALVNPIIAVLLGTIFFQEQLSSKLLGASVLVIFGLTLIIGFKKSVRVPAK